MSRMVRYMTFKDWATKKRFAASFEGYNLLTEHIHEGFRSGLSLEHKHR